MQVLHHHRPMLLLLRAFVTVSEEGSIRRAARRLHSSQSALSRQMQGLEAYLGGQLLERTTTGVRLTNGGRALLAKASALLASFDDTIVEVRRLLRGQSEHLRVGYVGSAADAYLEPALARLRQTHPKVKCHLFDLSPGEQIAALRGGQIEVALTDQCAEVLSLEFSTRKIATVPSIVLLPVNHALASRKKVRFTDLKHESFVNGLEKDMPGYNRRIAQLCRKHGQFRPKFVGHPENLSDGLELVANEEAILLLPAFVGRSRARPGVTVRSIADTEASWEVVVAWQPGPMTEASHALVDAFLSTVNAKQPNPSAVKPRPASQCR